MKDSESLFDWLGKKEQENRKLFTFQDSSTLEKILHELLFRSLLLHLVNRCQENCCDKLFPDKKDYLVVKSHDGISVMDKQMDSECCPFYIHFKTECLKEYTRCVHDVHHKAFSFLEITFGKDTLVRLQEEVKVLPEENGIDVPNNQE